MADELQLYLNPENDAGKTVVARVYNSAGAQVGSDVTCSEVGSLAIYQGDMPSAARGSYGVRFFEGSTFLGQGCIDWDGTTEITNETLDAAIAGVSGGGGGSLTAQEVWEYNISAISTEGQAGKELLDAQAVANVSGLATSADVAALNDITAGEVVAAMQAVAFDFQADTSGLSTLTAAQVNSEVDTALADYDGPTKAELDSAQSSIIEAIPTPSDIYTEFTTGNNEDAFKADVSSLSADVNVVEVNGVAVTDINDFKASGFATPANVSSAQSAIQADLAALNNISAADVWASATRTLTDKAGFELTLAERAAIATAVEQSILNEGDGQAVLNAIVGAIGNTNIDQVALVAAIRADLERAGGAIKAIESDTNELQTNQGNFSTATGFASPSDVTGARDAVITEVQGLNDLSSADISSALSTAEPLEANIIQVAGSSVTGVSDLQAPSTDLSSVTALLDEIIKYHNNSVRFFGIDGTTEVVQSDAYFMTVFDDDGTTVLKRIEFRNSSNLPSTVTQATRYIKTP